LTIGDRAGAVGAGAALDAGTDAGALLPPLALTLTTGTFGLELSTRTGRTREGSGCVVSQDGMRSADRGSKGAKGSRGRKAGVGGVK
jgi:hypothetical protein